MWPLFTMTRKTASLGANVSPADPARIDSWWDWKVSITVDEQDDATKHFFFATKAGQAAAPISAVFQANQTHDSLRIVPIGGKR